MIKKLSYSLLIVLLSVASFTTANAQDDKKPDPKAQKKEAKKWKKKLKAMDPLEFERIMKQHKELKTECDALKKSVEAVEKRKQDIEQQIPAKRKELIKAKQELEKIKDKEIDVTDNDDYKTGIVFKVQIGAFNETVKEGDIPLGDNSKVGAENEGDFHKFVMGHFRNYEQAKIFKDYLRSMGASGAFVVGYKDDVRIPDIKDALIQAGQDKYLDKSE